MRAAAKTCTAEVGEQAATLELGQKPLIHSRLPIVKTVAQAQALWG